MGREIEDDETELSQEEVSALLDKLIMQAVAAAKAESTDMIGEQPANSLSTPVRRSAMPVVGRPRRGKRS